jgi:hypothetical protein
MLLTLARDFQLQKEVAKMRLYHATSPEAAEAILERLQGWLRHSSDRP